jgi:hypothetical protein
MTRDLSEVFEAALVDDARALDGVGPSDAALGGMVRRVRRRRVVRTSARTLSIAAAGAGIAAAGWWGMREPVTPPATQPPSPGPDVTSSATPGPTTTSEPVPPDAALVVPGLPETHALPDGLLATAGPGWALGQYRSVALSGSPDEPLVNQLVVVAPDGTRYRAAELPAEWRLHLVRWDPGSATAVVQVVVGQEEGEVVNVRARLDIASGALSDERSGLPDGARFVGLDSDGRELWFGDVSVLTQPSDPVPLYVLAGASPARQVADVPPFARVYVNPVRPWVFLDAGVDAPYRAQLVIDTASAEATSATLGDGCSALGWTGPDQLLAVCTEGTGTTLRTYTVDVAGGASGGAVVHTFAAGEEVPFPEYGGSVDGSVAFVGQPLTDTQCVSTAYLWRDGGLAVLQAPRTADDRASVHAGPSGFVVESAPTCAGDPWLPTVTLHRTDGAVVDLLTVPPEQGGPWGETLAAWLVVGGPTG